MKLGVVFPHTNSHAAYKRKMPTLKDRKIFISHAWDYEEHYLKLEDWFDKEPNFTWSNCSVPSTAPLPDKSIKGLKEGMTCQINPSQVVIILGGMYAAYSDWIDYEIDEAQRMRKIIIGVKPWGQERIPLKVQNASICPMVGWNSASVIQAIREYS
jgi:hypothetical protein